MRRRDQPPGGSEDRPGEGPEGRPSEGREDRLGEGEALRPGPSDPEEEGATPEEGGERESAYGLLQRGAALMRQRHFAQAAVVLERAARLEPGKGSIVEALGRAYYNSGQHARAADAFRELLAIDPSLPYGHYALGQSLKQLGRHGEARTHLRLATVLSPQSRLYRRALERL